MLMGIIEFDGVGTPNREGHLPLHNDDPTTPNVAYWELCDGAVERAAELGIVLAIVPPGATNGLGGAATGRRFSRRKTLSLSENGSARATPTRPSTGLWAATASF